MQQTPGVGLGLQIMVLDARAQGVDLTRGSNDFHCHDDGYDAVSVFARDSKGDGDEKKKE